MARTHPENRGTFLVFEGLDGAGKSTQIERLAAALRTAGYTVCCTREPTDGPAGAEIRARSARGDPPPPEEELALFVADRRQHARECLEPELAAGHVVVCDRYSPSTAAYQGAHPALGLSADEILRRDEAELPIPDLVLLLVVDPRRALARVDARGEARNRAFERLEFLERVAANFAALERDYIVRIPADGDPEHVARAVREAVEARTGMRLG